MPGVATTERPLSTPTRSAKRIKIEPDPVPIFPTVTIYNDSEGNSNVKTEDGFVSRERRFARITAQVEDARCCHFAKQTERQIEMRALATRHAAEEAKELLQISSLEQLVAAARERGRTPMNEAEGNMMLPKAESKSTSAMLRKRPAKTKIDSGPVAMPSFIRALNESNFTRCEYPAASVKFSRNFLSKCIGGSSMSTYVDVGTKNQAQRIYPVKEYQAFSPAWNPHIPIKPGSHGAVLRISRSDVPPKSARNVNRSRSGDSKGLADDKLEDAIHTFVRREASQWQYCGQYKQGRPMTKLSQPEYRDLPDLAKYEWINGIAERDWGKDFLVREGVAQDRTHAQQFSREDIAALFDKPDDEAGIKLRFYWQYLICVGYDNKLYNALYAQWVKSGLVGRAVTGAENSIAVASVGSSSSDQEATTFRTEENLGQDPLHADDSLYD